jgi:hypothetical protein
LILSAHQVAANIIVEIQNGGAQVSEDQIRRLNEEDYRNEMVWKVSRKGPSHYNIGWRKAKWIAARLGAELSCDNPGGHFVARLEFTTQGGSR